MAEGVCVEGFSIRRTCITLPLPKGCHCATLLWLLCVRTLPNDWSLLTLPLFATRPGHVLGYYIIDYPSWIDHLLLWQQQNDRT